MQPVKCISRFDIFWMEPSTLRWISTRNHWLETGSSAQDIVQLSSLQNHGFNSSIGSNENIVSWTVVKKSDWIYVYAARHWYGFSIPFKLNRNTFVFLPPEISCQHTLPEGGFVTVVRLVNLKYKYKNTQIHKYTNTLIQIQNLSSHFARGRFRDCGQISESQSTNSSTHT